MALVSAETLAKSAGDLYVAPIGTGAPAEGDLTTVATLEAAGWVHVGWLDEDGPELKGMQGETTKHYGWNKTAPARSTTRITDPMVTVGLLQWNVENLQAYFPGATYDALTGVLTVSDSPTTTDKELLIIVEDGTVAVGLWFARTTVRGDEDISFPGDGLSPIPVAYDILSAEDSTDFFKVIGVDVASS